MKMLIRLLAAICISLSIGCSMTLGARGQTEDGSEFFTGSATGYTNGSGTITLVSKTGVICEGNFVYVTRREGSGVITTSDGRVGTFVFVSTGTNGTGHGLIGGKKFIFTFGGDPSSTPEPSDSEKKTNAELPKS